MSLGLLGHKIGMTRVFAEDGSSIPVTVVFVGTNQVVQKKTKEVDGYSAIQVKFGTRRASRVTSPLKGHYAKSGVESGSILKEFRLSSDQLDSFNCGDIISLDIFAPGDFVDVRSKSKGKGYAGGIKRHNFSSNRASHGNSRSHNTIGSTGQRQDPGRVFPGKKMPGQLGNEMVTIQNLVIVKVDKEHNVILIRGAIPGCTGTDVVILPSVKKGAK